MGLETVVSPVLDFIKSLSSPVQILGLLLVVVIIRTLVKAKFRKPPPPPREKPLEPLKKRDFTPQELVEYDGVKNKRVLLAVNSKVFDVTRGKDFYGPGESIKGYFIFEGFGNIQDIGLICWFHEFSKRQAAACVRFF